MEALYTAMCEDLRRLRAAGVEWNGERDTAEAAALALLRLVCPPLKGDVIALLDPTTGQIEERTVAPGTPRDSQVPPGRVRVPRNADSWALDAGKVVFCALRPPWREGEFERKRRRPRGEAGGRLLWRKLIWPPGREE